MKIAILSPLTTPIGKSYRELIPEQPLANKKVHPHPWVSNLAFGLVEMGHEVHILSLTKNVTKDVVFTQSGVIFHILKANHKLIRLLTFNYIDQKKVYRTLSRIQPDIVHGQGRQTDGLSAVRSHFPSVITSHGEIINELLSYKKDLKYRLKKYFEDRVNQKMKWAIGVSPTTVADLQRFLPVERTFLIDNAINPVFFDKRDISKQEYVLYVGAVSARKRVLDIVKAIELIEGAKLRIASQTEVSDAYYQTILKYIEDNRLKDKVEFCGNKNAEGVAKEISACLCTVLVSNFESFGMPLAEAQAVGKPVIGSRVGGVPFLVDENKSGFLVEPGNIDQIKEKIKYLYTNKSKAEEMGVYAAKQAMERWHPISVAQKTLIVYQKAIF